eukprot:4696063-Pleurochrysis_carterae.AAC.1
MAVTDRFADALAGVQRAFVSAFRPTRACLRLCAFSFAQTRQWCELSDASMASVAPPADWLDVPVPREVWLRRGLDLAPFTVQAQAPMSLVHFYFSQLTLDCVFVVDMGKFVGIINKADMTSGDL